MIRGHGGNIYALARRLGCRARDIIDMSSNVNPLGPMPEMMTRIQSHLEDMTALPEADSAGIIDAFARYHKVAPNVVLAGNGTTQLIYALPLALNLKTALILSPTYSDYQDACEMHGCRSVHLLSRAEADFQPDLDRLDAMAGEVGSVFVCNPNNPTGAILEKTVLEKIIRKHPGTCFIVDESYLPFVKAADDFSMIRSDLPNLAVLNSMSKIFRIPGLRIGFIKSSLDIIEKLQKFMLPWSVNSPAQVAVHYLMTENNKVDGFIHDTCRFLDGERKAFMDSFPHPSLIQWFDSPTSFLLGKLPTSVTAGCICDALAEQKILIRNCSNFIGLSDQYIRVSLKKPATNRLLSASLLELTEKMTLSQ
ncbi:MAG: pyridoxal phosphate-dependent class II aminotransferase [Desulfobacteraceae bacterium]|nr:pyridoxal phosphate-dependent class II aminotransferase [Desulfobacteraceae bacterium]